MSDLKPLINPLSSNILQQQASPVVVKKVLVAVTGSIAAYKSVILVRRLKDAGVDVRVLMTQGGQSFVTPLTFQAVSGHPVHTTLLDTTAEAGMGHIELAKWADLIVIAPASANQLARLSIGLADDLLGAVVLATAVPVWIAPAMNQQMWANEATQTHVSTLRARGYRLLQPDAGIQACGDIGAGRMPEPEFIAAEINHYLTQDRPQPLKNKHIVITAGPTREAIDPVRYLSNHSTGKMGFALAEACRDAGARVTLIAGPVALPTPTGIERINITSALDLLNTSSAVVEKGCDAFIATAAVADYRAQEIAAHKIKKSDDALEIQLVKNPDVVASIAQHAKRPFMVGFAAETQRMEEYARGKLTNKQLDMIACNDVSRNDIGFASDDNAMTVFFADKLGFERVDLAKAPKPDIAKQLVDCMVAAGV